MATNNIGDGAIAGAITGFIIGLVTIILGLIGLASLASYININAVFGGLLPGFGTVALATITGLLVFLVFTVIVGLILGAIFGAILEYIPTRSLLTKGVIFMVAIWVIFGLIIPVIVGASARLPAGLTATSVLISLIAAVIWGLVLGAALHWVISRTMAPVRGGVIRTH